MATDAFVSSAGLVGNPVGILLDQGGTKVFTRRGFYVSNNKGNVTITKAPSFGGVQAALSFPITQDDARDLAAELIKAVT